MSFKRVLTGALLCASALLSMSSPVSAEPALLTCSFEASADGFDVSWDSKLTADRYVVERFARRRFWWRTRSNDAIGEFSDGAAPNASSTMRYRVIAKEADGTTIETATCAVADSRAFLCQVTQLADDTYSISWSGAPTAPQADIIVRRQVSAGGQFYWRQRTTDTQATDTASPTGSATYRLVSRSNNVINAITTCTSNVVAPPPPGQL